MAVMFQEERFKMCQRVLFAKHPPDAVFVAGIAVVELYSLQLGKLLNQSLIDGEVLLAVLSWRFVLMFTYALFQELRH